MDGVELYDSLDGQVALVTGASRGIGEEVAAVLASHDATVYAGARDVADVDAPDQHPILLDVTADDQIQAAAERIRDEHGKLDILVNNAGVVGTGRPLHEQSIETIDETLSVNLRGAVLVARATLPLLLETEGPRIVNVSSGMGALGEGMSGGYGPYRISKAGINGLSAYLHGEYNRRGLMANAVCPGWVRTDMGGPGASRSVAEGADTPAWLARFAPGGPSGRFWRSRRVIDW
ncbi:MULTISPECIES: SDR family NAD(P)-dependent oxidoreductase [unclassified Haladaptatus]|uniref:SDR family NAD(P)-dependent oxidoreductase n=1 Tax=unclassified Haladaptatus TaxID=2622732 RepID=UPI0023E82088|nr:MULTISPECIES: SDR family NAD(P)-dependent oxidoreductase [unclassified Haladaptatus]